MKNENKITLAILKEKISSDNVLAISELIAVSETKFLIGYMGERMLKIHMDLYIDIIRKNNVNHTLVFMLKFYKVCCSNTRTSL